MAVRLGSMGAGEVSMVVAVEAVTEGAEADDKAAVQVASVLQRKQSQTLLSWLPSSLTAWSFWSWCRANPRGDCAGAGPCAA